MIRSEQLLKEAREQDHTCEVCYYVHFDDKAYPCSRCVCNQPTENMWKPKPQAEREGECKWCGDKQVCGRCRSRNLYAPKDEPQERSE